MRKRSRQFLTWIIAALVLSPAALAFAAWAYLHWHTSKIVNFHPANFAARADSPFFYSMGDDLKCADNLDPGAPTLLHAKLGNYLVAPDNQKIAIVADEILTIVSRDSTNLQNITSVNSIYRAKPLGQSFFRDADFQWSRDSQSLFLIRDEFYAPKGSQLFSTKGELWRYRLDTGELRLILKPFPAQNYFFGPGSEIFFAAPDATGAYRLRYFDGSRIRPITESRTWAIPDTDAASSKAPFASFPEYDYQTFLFPAKGIAFVRDSQGGPERLVIRGRQYLATTLGWGIEGSSYCSDGTHSTYLPGDRYFVVNLPDCANYKGQLLIDTVTGRYKALPQETRVYLPFNTESYRHFKVTEAGISPK